jgi:hypothetical protein
MLQNDDDIFNTVCEVNTLTYYMQQKLATLALL